MNSYSRCRLASAIVMTLFGGPRLHALHAQQATGDSPALRPLADRASLEALAAELQSRPGREAASELERVRERLAQGDFHGGDRILIRVQGESSLTDTFTITPERSLLLPSPVVGALSLQGVLRSELESRVERFVRRFVHNPVVRARPLLRLSVQGEVAHGGYYDVAADLVLGDVVMAAGGTTQDADVDKLRIERNGRRIWEGRALQQALADGRTLDGASLNDGDLVFVPRRRSGSLGATLGFIGVVFSVTAGAFALAQNF